MSDVNDLEAILSVTNTDVDEFVHAVTDNADAIFTWDYEKGRRPALNRLYEKAKGAQWNGETDLPWDTDVDQEAVVLANAEANMGGLMMGIDESVIADTMAAFGFIRQLTTEPLLKQLLQYVMADEARHVAFGVLSLREYYAGLSDAELAERQEFAFEAAVRMRDRFLQQEVWDRMGLDVKKVLPLVMAAPQRTLFQSMLFSKIVPNCRKLGLLDANGGWLRQRFTDLGVIGFEDNPDTGEEYDMFQLAQGGDTG